MVDGMLDIPGRRMLGSLLVWRADTGEPNIGFLFENMEMLWTAA